MNGKLIYNKRIIDKAHLLNLDQIKDNNKNDYSEKCYSEVLISPKTHHITNEVVWITARDKKTNEQFKSKISFGELNRLQITKKFDFMNKGEVSELNVNVKLED